MNSRRFRRQLLVLYVVFVLVGILSLPFFLSPKVSAVSDPDSISVESVKVFRNLWETGDQLYFMEYKVMYAVDPTEDPGDTFLVGIFEGATLHFTRPLNYYDHNIISIYLDSGDALTWEGAYSIKVMGNPVYFALVEDTNMDTHTLAPSNWNANSSRDDNRSDLGDWLLDIAAVLEISWGETLTTASGLLDTAGALVFRAAIPGLSNITPRIFQVATLVPIIDEPSFTRSYQTTLDDSFGARLDTAFTNLGAWVGIPGLVVAGVGFSILFFILSGRIFLATGSTTAAVVLAIPFIIMGNLLGVIPLAVTFIIGFTVLILFGVTFVLGRFA